MDELPPAPSKKLGAVPLFLVCLIVGAVLVATIGSDYTDGDRVMQAVISVLVAGAMWMALRHL